MSKLTPWLGLLLLGAAGCAKQSVPCESASALPLEERLKASCPDGQVCGSTGCRSCAGDSECGGGLKCCAGACTPGDSCPSCSSSQECRSGDVCCDGACVTGDCCSAASCAGLACIDHRCATSAPSRVEPGGCTRNTDCPEGQACVAGSCTGCSADQQCGADARCCAGQCVAGECCSDSECSGGKCTNNSCQACVTNSECGAGKLCLGGGCVTGDCSSSADCSGRICRQSSCQACTRSSQCEEGSTCCGGLCVTGSCCDDGDCAPGQVCHNRQCGACSHDLDCGPDLQCCSGACVAGACPAKAVSLTSRVPEPAKKLTCLDGRCFEPRRLASYAVVSCSGDAECGLGGKCCNSGCVSGDCCADSQCPSPLVCLQYACQSCTSDGMCGAGKVCCNGACAAGDCCPGAPCPGGQVCTGYSCAACTKNTDCGSGKACCNGACKEGNCCTNAECGQYVCTRDYCAACVTNLDCGPNSMCCGGACVAGAACCSRQDCPGDKTCSGNQCVTCTRDTDCGFDSKCCAGSCVSGNCCATADCKPGSVCNSNNYCGSCGSDSQCAAGQRCCSGSCVDGTCCASSECGAGKVCTSNSCSPCQSTAECGVGQRCCNGGCQSGNCCNTAECAGLVCVGNLCTQCTTDVQCGAGSKCCRGACYPGVACCSSTDCVGRLSCLNGQCSSCTSAADCGGQQCCRDSTGVGRCQTFCSVAQTWSTQATFNLGSFNGTTTGGASDGGVGPACAVGTLCWSGQNVVVQTPYIWIPASGDGTVYRYNTDTLQRVGPFNTGVNSNWPATAGTAVGTSPSRTSVNAADNTLWVANRGVPAPAGGVAHLDAEGNMICYGAVPGGPRAVAIDAAGNVWVGSYYNKVMYKFSGSEFAPISSNPKTCKLLLTMPVPGNPYGAATDNRNQVWVQGSGKVFAIDANTAKIVAQYSIGAYGITVDKDFVWLSYCNGGTCRLRKSNGQLTTYPLRSISGIAATKEYVYTGAWPGQYTPAGPPNYGRIRIATGAVDRVTLPSGSWTIAVAADSAGRIWSVDYFGAITRTNLNGSQTTLSGRPAQYVYTDITGLQTVNAGLTPGFWSIVYDSQYRFPRWQKITLDATLPTGTGVSVRVRAADTAAGLAQPGPTFGWTNWRDFAPPGGTALVADLTTLQLATGIGVVPSKQFLEIQIKLTTSSDQTTPVVKAISADWAP